MKNIILFDVDGTLTSPRLPIAQNMIDKLHELKKLDDFDIGIVGGSDIEKQREQLGEAIKLFDWIFAENGLDAYKNNDNIENYEKTSITDHYTNDELNEIINVALSYILQLDIPIKRGTFIEFRNGMLNVSPIGRNCSQKERMDFFEYDKQHNIRKNMIKYMKTKLNKYDLQYSIGGQISFDVYPKNWNKTFCLKYVRDIYENIYFFGDKTYEGGNDYEIYIDNRTISYSVKSPENTISILNDKFL